MATSSPTASAGQPTEGEQADELPVDVLWMTTGNNAAQLILRSQSTILEVKTALTSSMATAPPIAQQRLYFAHIEVSDTSTLGSLMLACALSTPGPSPLPLHLVVLNLQPLSAETREDEGTASESDETIHIRSIYSSGSQDTYLKRAQDSARLEYKSGGAVDHDKTTTGDVKRAYNGNYDKNAKTTCISYNLGKDHPLSSLNQKGVCKHNHTCDHWVSDKGPGGICGGAHPRFRCTNPNKCDAKQK